MGSQRAELDKSHTAVSHSCAWYHEINGMIDRNRTQKIDGLSALSQTSFPSPMVACLKMLSGNIFLYKKQIYLCFKCSFVRG